MSPTEPNTTTNVLGKSWIVNRYSLAIKHNAEDNIRDIKKYPTQNLNITSLLFPKQKDNLGKIAAKIQCLHSE